MQGLVIAIVIILLAYAIVLHNTAERYENLDEKLVQYLAYAQVYAPTNTGIEYRVQ